MFNPTSHFLSDHHVNRQNSKKLFVLLILAAVMMSGVLPVQPAQATPDLPPLVLQSTFGGRVGGMAWMLNGLYIGVGEQVKVFTQPSLNHLVESKFFSVPAGAMVDLLAIGDNLYALTTHGIALYDASTQDSTPLKQWTESGGQNVHFAADGNRMIVAEQYMLHSFAIDMSTGQLSKTGTFTSPLQTGFVLHFEDIVIIANYAYALRNHTVETYDISGNIPTPLSTYTLHNSYSMHLAIVNGLVVAFDNTGIIFLQPDGNGVLQKTATITDPSLYIMNVLSDRNRLFVFGGFGLVVYDISNPSQPRSLGVESNILYATDYVAKRDNTLAVLGANQIVVVGELANGKHIELSRLDMFSDSLSDATVVGNYAIVSAQSQYYSFDLTQPAQPRVSSNLVTNNYADRLLQSKNKVLAYSGATFTLLNVSNPAMLRAAQTVTINDWAFTMAAAFSYPFLYLVGYSNSISQFAVIDVSLSETTTVPSGRLTLETFRNWTSLDVLDDTAAVLSVDGRLIIVTVNPSSNPHMAGSISLPVTDSTTYSQVVLAGEYAYISGRDALLIVDITDPSQPSLVKSLPYVGIARIQKIDDVLYAFTQNRIDQLDLTDPVTPLVIAQMSTPLSLCGHASGSGARIVLACGSGGLKVLGSESMLPDQLQRIRLPLSLRNASDEGAGDLRLRGMEVTQAIQDMDNNVPLVQDRPTLVRVYVNPGANLVADDLTVTLEGWRNGQALPDSPMQIDAWAAFSGFNRGRLGHSFNFDLPASWLSGDVQLTAQVSAGSISLFDSDPSNNAQTVTVAFYPVPPLNVVFVPINYTDTATGAHFPAVNSYYDIPNSLLQQYPVSAVVHKLHAAMNFSGDLSQGLEWGRLLQTIASMKISEGSSGGQVYYGLVPVIDDKGNNGGNRLAISGMGFYNIRASVGRIDSGGGLAAHEIGHNMGRQHAPCGGVADPDPNFPYPGASIGQYGYRSDTALVMGPDKYHDTMSYCSNWWFSDYNYRAIFEVQRAHGQVAAVTNASSAPLSVLVRMQLLPDGQITWLPMYVLPLTPDAPAQDSPYSVELLDAKGNLLARKPFAFSHAEEMNYVIDMAQVVVPVSGLPIAAMRVVSGTTTLDNILLRDIDKQMPSASMQKTQQAGGTLISWQSHEPVLVRASADGGLTWTTLGVDVTDASLFVSAADFAGTELVEVIPAISSAH